MLSVPDGVGVQLHAQDAAGAGGRDDAYGSDTAVGVEDGLFAGEGCKVDGDVVELLSHQRVDLKEGAGGDAKTLSAEDVLDIAFPVNDCLAVSQDHGRVAVIYVYDDGRDLGVELYELSDKGIAGGKDGIGQNQGHHDLLCRPGSADLDIAKEPAVHILVIDPDAKVSEQAVDGLDDPVRLDMLDQAGLHRDDLVRALPVNAADGVSLPVPGKDRCHLVTVMLGSFHAYKGVRCDVFSNQFLQIPLFSFNLLIIGNVDHCAAPAQGGDRAAGFLFLS